MRVTVAFVLAAVTVTANASSLGNRQTFLGRKEDVESAGPADIEVFNSIITRAIDEELYTYWSPPGFTHWTAFGAFQSHFPEEQPIFCEIPERPDCIDDGRYPSIHHDDDGGYPLFDDDGEYPLFDDDGEYPLFDDDGEFPLFDGDEEYQPGRPENLGPDDPDDGRPKRPDDGRPKRPDDGRPKRPDDGRPKRPDDGREPPREPGPPDDGEPRHPGPPDDGEPRHPEPPHRRPWRPGRPHPPPEHGKPGKQPHPPPEHGKPGKRPHHPPEHGKPGKRPHPPHHPPWPPRPPRVPKSHPHHFNLTLYDLVRKGNVTSKFYELIKDDEKIKDLLSDTSKNFTLLVPINDAFEAPPHFDKPHHAPNFTGDLAHAVATYHIIPGFYPFYELNMKKTLETCMDEPALGSKDGHQRIRIGREFEEGFGEGPNPCRKTAINVISKVIAADFFGTNGVVHAISHILLPPPPTLTLIHLFPAEFSTFMLAVWKTGLVETINDLSGKGLTIFPPANRRWEQLPWDVLTFLFSPHGEKYLQALIKYHIVPEIIQYTDETTRNDSDKDEDFIKPFYVKSDEVLSEQGNGEGVFDWVRSEYGERPHGPPRKDWPRGKYHADLPTLLEGKNISVDILREGWWFKWRLNGDIGLFPNDIISKEGVVQVPRAVLFPPNTDKPPKLSFSSEFDEPEFHIPETVEELKARFKGIVEDE